jgi:signal transduction histidine kinase
MPGKDAAPEGYRGGAAVGDLGIMDNNDSECARLQKLVAELIAAQEAERSELAGELQHQMAQYLTALKYHLEGLRSPDPDRLQESLSEARVLVDGLVDRVRRLSLRLRPSMLDDLGLRPALDWYVECFQEQTGMRVDLQHRGLDGRFPPEVETAAFRVAQELLQNVAEHAGTDRVVLRVWAQDQRLGLQVEDAGNGFVPDEALAQNGGRGLMRVQQRVAWLEGSMDVSSKPGTGSRITIEFPLSTLTEESP